MAKATKKKAVAEKLEFETVRVAPEGTPDSEIKKFTVAHGKFFIGNGRYLPVGTVVETTKRDARLGLKAGTLVDGIDEDAIRAGMKVAKEAAEEEARIAAEEDDE